MLIIQTSETKDVFSLVIGLPSHVLYMYRLDFDLRNVPCTTCVCMHCAMCVGSNGVKAKVL